MLRPTADPMKSETTLDTSTTSRTIWLLVGAGVIVATLLFRLWVIVYGGFDLSFDEAYYWHWSKNLDWCYFSKGPGIALLIRGMTELFGDNDFAIRMGALTCSTLSLIILFIWSRRFFASERTAAVSVLLISSVPFLVGLGILTTIDSPLILCWTLATATLWEALRSGRAVWWLMVGLAIAAGTQFKFTMLLFLACVLVCLLVEPAFRPQLRKSGPYLAIAVVLVSMIPILVWNISHEWITLGHTVDKASTGEKPPLVTLRYLLPSLGTQLGIASPIIGVAALVATLLLGFNALGFGQAIATHLDPRRSRFLLGVAAPVLILYGLLAFHRRIEANWLAVVYLTLVPAAAHYWLHPFRRWQQATLVLGVILGWVIVAPLAMKDSFYRNGVIQQLVDAGIGFHPGLDITNRVVGRKQLGPLVHERVREIERETGQTPFVLTDHYSMAAWIGYYGRIPDQVFVTPSPIPRNQFDLWSWEGRLPPTGADALLAHVESKSRHRVEHLFGEVEEGFEAVPIERGGMKIRTYLFRQGYRFNGPQAWFPPERLEKQMRIARDLPSDAPIGR